MLCFLERFCAFLRGDPPQGITFWAQKAPVGGHGGLETISCGFLVDFGLLLEPPGLPLEGIWAPKGPNGRPRDMFLRLFLELQNKYRKHPKLIKIRAVFGGWRHA